MTESIVKMTDISVGKDFEELDPLYIEVGEKSDIITLEKTLAVPQNVKHGLTV